MPIPTVKDMWYWSIVNIPLKVYRQPAVIHELGSSLTKVTKTCQEIGLVAFMFFFEPLFFYASSSISFYVPLTNLFSIIHSPYLLITRDTQDEGEARFQFY